MSERRTSEEGLSGIYLYTYTYPQFAKFSHVNTPQSHRLATDSNRSQVRMSFLGRHGNEKRAVVLVSKHLKPFACSLRDCTLSVHFSRFCSSNFDAVIEATRE